MTQFNSIQPNQAGRAEDPNDCIRLDFTGALPRANLGRPRRGDVVNMPLGQIEKNLRASGLFPEGAGNMLTAVRAAEIHANLRLDEPDAPQSDNPDSTAQLKIFDLCATRVADCREIVRAMHQLAERCAVPEDVRLQSYDSGIETRGLWFVDAVSDLRSRLELNGAQLLVLRDSSERLWGFVIYHTEEHELPKHEKELIRAARKELGLGDGVRIGLSYEIAVDPAIFLPPTAGGLGIRRREAAAILNSYMIGEGLSNGLEMFVGYVWEEPFKNRAIKGHDACGWRGLRTTISADDINPQTGDCAKIIGRGLYLDLRDPQIIGAAHRLIASPHACVDLDPDQEIQRRQELGRGVEYQG